MYLESVAMVPQIYMFQRVAADEGGTVEVSGFNTGTIISFNTLENSH